MSIFQNWQNTLPLALGPQATLRVMMHNPSPAGHEKIGVLAASRPQDFDSGTTPHQAFPARLRSASNLQAGALCPNPAPLFGDHQAPLSVVSNAGTSIQYAHLLRHTRKTEDSPICPSPTSIGVSVYSQASASGSMVQRRLPSSQESASLALDVATGCIGPPPGLVQVADLYRRCLGAVVLLRPRYLPIRLIAAGVFCRGEQFVPQATCVANFSDMIYSCSAPSHGSNSQNSTVQSHATVPGSSSGRHNSHHTDRGRQPSRASGNSAQYSTVDATAADVDAQPVVCIMYWNIFHDFSLKLTSGEFHKILATYDIMLFAETDMRPGEEDSANVPAGFTLVSLPAQAIL
ncbi:hypothetical protein B0H14DRAFT_2581555 [Mycena olivaceomarginata]|nr:hypothetical protein B0H14DRAFT_2581555 [Mycena olivaceomarginata]